MIAKSVLGALLITIALLGCSDTPSTSESERIALQTAENDSPVEGIKFTDLERDNGWLDSASNHYFVRYKYNLEAQGSYAELLIRTSTDLAREMTETKISDSERAVVVMALDLAKRSNLHQLDAIKAGVKEASDNHTQLRTFLKTPTNAPKPFDDSSTLVLMSAVLLAEKGFFGDFKKGFKVPRITTQEYMKTEQGWKLVQH